MKMYKFEVGQEVVFSKGDLKDVKGVVHNPFWQVSQTDWPEIIVVFSDKQGTVRTLFVGIDAVRPAVDPYEYATTWLDWNDKYFPIEEGEWGTLANAEHEAKFVGHHKGMTGVKIMRRLKAGEAEDYNA
jgi:hypothetical protein